MVDEIDKADIEFPNDLLQELDRMEFYCYETGETIKAIRSSLPNAHYATVYAKPSGREQVDTFITEVSQDTWIYFPWDMEMKPAPTISERTQK